MAIEKLLTHEELSKLLSGGENSEETYFEAIPRYEDGQKKFRLFEVQNQRGGWSASYGDISPEHIREFRVFTRLSLGVFFEEHPELFEE